MRTYILSFVLVMCTLGLFAQSKANTTDIQIGAIYEIGKPKTNMYKYINFPKPNMIIKRGGIANYKLIKGSIVVVTSVKKKKDGTTIAKIKRKDGGRFFGSHAVITTDINNALQWGELIAK